MVWPIRLSGKSPLPSAGSCLKNGTQLHCRRMLPHPYSPPPRFARTKGFTLIEVMVSLAIVGVLAALAAPSFVESIKRYRVNAIRDDLVASLQLARAEAIRRGKPVVVIRELSCQVTLPDSDTWSCGWRVVEDSDSDGSISVGERNNPIQKTTVPVGYDVMHTGLGNQAIASRWGQIGVGQKFVITASSDGVNGASTTTLCMSSGGRIRTIRGEATC